MQIETLMLGYSPKNLPDSIVSLAKNHFGNDFNPAHDILIELAVGYLNLRTKPTRVALHTVDEVLSKIREFGLSDALVNQFMFRLEECINILHVNKQ